MDKTISFFLKIVAGTFLGIKELSGADRNHKVGKTVVTIGEGKEKILLISWTNSMVLVITAASAVKSRKYAQWIIATGEFVSAEKANAVFTAAKAGGKKIEKLTIALEKAAPAATATTEGPKRVISDLQ